MTSESDAPSRTARKKASEELQNVGEQLLELRPSVLAALPLPETLRDAILEAKRLSTFGAKRRQAQFIGKLMRRLDPETLQSVRAALRTEQRLPAKEAQLLHQAEQWRDSLIADDDRLTQWIEEFPGTDAELLRALIREARSETSEAGEARRKGSAYRRIFKIVRARLGSSASRVS